MKIRCIAILASLTASTCAVAQDFCSRLGAKLNHNSNSNSIVQTIRYNYTTSGIHNYAQLVEYRYDTQIVPNAMPSQNQDVEVDSDDESAFENFKNNKINSSGSATVRLANCSVSGNSANFSIKRIIPALTLNYYHQNDLPQFNINFIKRGGIWEVSSVSSNNFNALIHESLSNVFRNYYQRINRTTPETFYKVNLREMVIQQIYPAHIRELTSHFNGIVQVIN